MINACTRCDSAEDENRFRRSSTSHSDQILMQTRGVLISKESDGPLPVVKSFLLGSTEKAAKQIETFQEGNEQLCSPLS